MGDVLGLVAIVVYLAIIVLLIASIWKVYTKAGEPGWAAIVPIYNVIVMLRIVGKPLWWFALYLIPVVNFVIAILVCIELAKCFGKSTGFGVGLVLLGPIFFPILGLGSAQYTRPAGVVTAMGL
jgi:hypothetical protein